MSSHPPGGPSSLPPTTLVPSDGPPTDPSFQDPELQRAIEKLAYAGGLREVRDKMEEFRVAVAPAVEAQARWDLAKASIAEFFVDTCRKPIGFGTFSAEARTLVITVFLFLLVLGILALLGVTPLEASTEARRWWGGECVPAEPAP